MTKEELTRELESLKAKHSNDKHYTGQLNISDMCADILDVLGKCEERKQGKWIKYNTADKYDYMGDRVTVSNYQCSECGRMIYDIGDAPLTNKLKDYPFCHCGADMRGAENE